MYFGRKGRPVITAALLLFSVHAAWPQTEEQASKSHQAKQLMAEGRFADAVPIYTELSAALPSNTGLRLNLALALHMSGNHVKAIPEFERVLKSDPASVPALLSLGAAYLETQQPERAVVPLQKVVRLQPDHVPPRGMLANALLHLNRPKEALPHFAKLTVLSPNDPKSWYGLGRCYDALSASAFEELNRTAQGSAEWLTIVGDSRLERGQNRSAFYFFKQALEKDGSFSHAHQGLADVYHRTGHDDWAALEKKRISKPDCVKEKERCAFGGRRYTQAAASANPYWRVRAYNELAREAYAALESLPESVELHVMKAEIFTQRNKPNDAVSELRSAAKLAPSDYGVARQLAIALHAAHDYDAALPALVHISVQEPDAADIQYYLGDIWLQKAQPEKAGKYLEAAVKLDAGTLPARAALGTALSRMSRHAEAIPHLTAALSIDEDGSLHYQLARALQASGQAEQAQSIMAKYRELNERSTRETEKLESEAAITAPQ